MELYYIAIAFVIDLIVGDPCFLPHPIVLIGKFISFMEKQLRKVACSPKALKRAGVVLLITTVIFSASIVLVPLFILKQIGKPLYIAAYIYFSYAILSTKCLKDEAVKVKKALEKSLEDGRRQVGYIVGRDTTELSEDEVIKATVETVAENTTDGIIAPLLFLFIGGPALAMAYKGVNTLDSMVGYKNERYIDFGSASAITDDILNFIPARVSGFVMVAASMIAQFDFKKSLEILLRDHDKHNSPNSAWTEAAAAGALNIQLGGTHTYYGKEVYKPTIGDYTKEIEVVDIDHMNKLMLVTCCLFMVLGLAVGFVISSLVG